MPVDSKAIAVSLAVNGAICVLSLALFSGLRILTYSKRFYMPKWYSPVRPVRPLQVSAWPWSWMRAVMRHSQARLIAVAGLDGAVYMRMILFGLHLFCCLSVWCLAVVLPVNLAGKEVDKIISEQKSKAPPAPEPEPGPFPPSPSGNISNQGNYRFSDIDRMSMSNIQHGSPVLWVHLISVYVITVLVLWLLWKYNKEVVELRVVHLGRASQRGPARSILVTDIPSMPYGTFLEVCVRLINESLLRFLPLVIKKRIERAALKARDVTEQGISNVAANVASALTQHLLAPGSEGHGEEYIGAELSEAQLVEAKAKLDIWGKARRALQAGETPEDMVSEVFEFIYSPGAVKAVHMALDQRFCGPLLAQYESTMMLLEDHLDMYKEALEKGKKLKKIQRMRVVGALYGTWGIQEYGNTPKQVDVVKHCMALLRHLGEEIAKIQNDHVQLNVPAGFVTFRTRWHQAVASTALQFHDETTWRCQRAPGPDEVIWDNLGMRLWEIRIRKTLAWAAFYTLLLFYLAPVTAIQGLLQVERLRHIPLVQLLVETPLIRSVLVGILPGLALRLFLMVLPWMLWGLNTKAGAVSISQVDFAVVQQYFGFQVAIVFLASFIIGSLANQVTQLLKHPETILQVLGVSTPQTASFFIIYILFTGLTVQPLQFLRLGMLFVFWLRHGFAGTARAHQRLEKPEVQYFGTYVADHSITLLLGLVFCIINPLILPACLLYFIVQWPLQCYQQLYVMERPYDSGGRIWAQVFTHFMIALYMFQLVMAALLSIKRFPFTPLLLLPLALAAFFHNHMTSLFKRPLSAVSLHDAAMQDDQEKVSRDLEGASRDYEERQLMQLYQHPILKIDLSKLGNLLEEANNVYDTMRGFIKAPGMAAIGDSTGAGATAESHAGIIVWGNKVHGAVPASRRPGHGAGRGGAGGPGGGIKGTLGMGGGLEGTLGIGGGLGGNVLTGTSALPLGTVVPPPGAVLPGGVVTTGGAMLPGGLFITAGGVPPDGRGLTGLPANQKSGLGVGSGDQIPGRMGGGGDHKPRRGVGTSDAAVGEIAPGASPSAAGGVIPEDDEILCRIGAGAGLSYSSPGVQQLGWNGGLQYRGLQPPGSPDRGEGLQHRGLQVSGKPGEDERLKYGSLQQQGVPILRMDVPLWESDLHILDVQDLDVDAQLEQHDVHAVRDQGLRASRFDHASGHTSQTSVDPEAAHHGRSQPRNMGRSMSSSAEDAASGIPVSMDAIQSHALLNRTSVSFSDSSVAPQHSQITPTARTPSLFHATSASFDDFSVGPQHSDIAPPASTPIAPCSQSEYHTPASSSLTIEDLHPTVHTLLQEVLPDPEVLGGESQASVAGRRDESRKQVGEGEGSRQRVGEGEGRGSRHPVGKGEEIKRLLGEESWWPWRDESPAGHK